MRVAVKLLGEPHRCLEIILVLVSPGLGGYL